MQINKINQPDRRGRFIGQYGPDYFVNIHNMRVEFDRAGYKKEAVELLEKARDSYSASSYDGNQFTIVVG